MKDNHQAGHLDPAETLAILIERNRRIAGYVPRPLPGQEDKPRSDGNEPSCAG